MDRRHPNLFIVGAPRCGTMAWMKYLGDHPDVFFAERKEPHYFSSDFPDFRWAETEAEYLDFFSAAAGERVIGEASPMYLYSAVAAERIADRYPQAKILILLRRQERFLPSYHQMLLNNLDEAIATFPEAWAKSGLRTAACIPRTCRAPAFLDYKVVGRFSDQVARYLSAFPREQVMVMDYDKWSADTLTAYRAVLEFLGLGYDGRQAFPKINAATHFRSKALAALTQAPSPRLLWLAALLKRAPFLRALKPARLLRALNRAPGYQSAIPAGLSAEIAGCFETDNRRLAALVGDPTLLSLLARRD